MQDDELRLTLVREENGEVYTSGQVEMDPVGNIVFTDEDNDKMPIGEVIRDALRWVKEE